MNDNNNTLKDAINKTLSEFFETDFHQLELEKDRIINSFVSKIIKLYGKILFIEVSKISNL
ncbi:MAG: hypothetical protein ACTSRI_05075 [Promethearchaeota archaeon]